MCRRSHRTSKVLHECPDRIDAFDSCTLVTKRASLSGYLAIFPLHGRFARRRQGHGNSEFSSRSPHRSHRNPTRTFDYGFGTGFDAVGLTEYRQGGGISGTNRRQVNRAGWRKPSLQTCAKPVLRGFSERVFLDRSFVVVSHQRLRRR